MGHERRRNRLAGADTTQRHEAGRRHGAKCVSTTKTVIRSTGTDISKVMMYIFILNASLTLFHIASATSSITVASLSFLCIHFLVILSVSEESVTDPSLHFVPFRMTEWLFRSG